MDGHLFVSGSDSGEGALARGSGAEGFRQEGTAEMGEKGR